MKILMITEFFPTGKDLKFSGGVEARTFFVAKYLAKRHKVSILVSRTIGSKREENISGIKVFRIGPKRNYSAATSNLISRINFIKNAIRFGANLDVDIIDGGNYIAHFIAKQIANKKKIPVVAWYPDVWIGQWFKNTGPYGLFGEILERINLTRDFDTYIAISKQTALKLQKYVKGKINLIYCGVEKDEFKGNVEKFKNPTIICVSRLTKYKNIKTLILAFAHLTTRIKNARLIIVGTGPEEKSLKNLAHSLKISSKVDFFSNLPRKKLIDIYQTSHIFSLPSTVEGFGIATVEAASAGLPFVNSNIPIQREITKNGQGGYLVQSLAPLSFSQKFYQLFKNKSLYFRKSRDAIKLAEHYKWHKTAFQTEIIYKKMLHHS